MQPSPTPDLQPAYATNHILDSLALIQHSLSKTGGVTMTEGSVKWFNNAKGYGFIISEEGGEELFAHYTAIAM